MPPSPKRGHIIKTTNMLKCNSILTDSFEAFSIYSMETYPGRDERTDMGKKYSDDGKPRDKII